MDDSAQANRPSSFGSPTPRAAFLIRAGELTRAGAGGLGTSCSSAIRSAENSYTDPRLSA